MRPASPLPPPSTRHRPNRWTSPARRTGTAVVGGLLLAALAACGATGGGASGAGSGDAAEDPAGAAAYEPVTLEHAFGETVLEERPERVVTWGWGSSDAVLALGEVPVAMPRHSYGAEENGLMPWQADALDELRAEVPTLLSETDGPPFEEIAAAAPDVILAHYSGITEADYEKLSAIAPTVAYPDLPWSTPWREVITTTGEVLGEPEAAAQLLADVDAEVAAAAEAHPEFAGRTIAAIAVDPSALYVYTPEDPRVQFLEDLGFTVADSVGELATGGSTFFYTLSTERLDELTSDVLLSYVPSEERQAELAEDRALQSMLGFRDGTVAEVVGEAVVSSVSPPTALSLSWGLDTFVDALAPAAEAARG